MINKRCWRRSSRLIIINKYRAPRLTASSQRRGSSSSSRQRPARRELSAAEIYPHLYSTLVRAGLELPPIGLNAACPAELLLLPPPPPPLLMPAVASLSRGAAIKTCESLGDCRGRGRCVKPGDARPASIGQNQDSCATPVVVIIGGNLNDNTQYYIRAPPIIYCIMIITLNRVHIEPKHGRPAATCCRAPPARKRLINGRINLRCYI